MSDRQNPALVEVLYQLADDDLIIGHRDSEWLGLAPHIEADIAFASIAQDEVGHAASFYRLLEELGEGKADDLAFLRPAADRRNAILLERPNGAGTYLEQPEFEWGFTIVRHLAYDIFDAIRLEALTRSSCQPLAKMAAKIRREERYHLLHQATWFKRLATGTAESRRRLEMGIAKVWPEVSGLFAMGAAAGGDIFPATAQDLLDRWAAEFKAQFEAVGIQWSPVPVPDPDGRSGQHTPELEALLTTMGEVHRSVPGASW